MVERKVFSIANDNDMLYTPIGLKSKNNFQRNKLLDSVSNVQTVVEHRVSA
jgi:hypothetical protein